MADRPITFSGPMVRALLAGTKTQTRRAHNVAPGLEHLAGSVAPRIKVGDRLYVREHWRTSDVYDGIAPRDLTPPVGLWYEADEKPEGGVIAGKFRQAMHMPKWASRITLHVTEVRVQRLMDISEADCLAEGVLPYDGGGFTVPGICVTDGPRSAYFTLLDHLHGQGFSVKNPWVTATTFEVERCNIAQARAA